MLRIHKRPEAENDLDEIWWYIAQDNPVNADKFIDEIETTCRQLARFTSMGKNRDELHPGLQSFPVGKYLIFYMPRDCKLICVNGNFILFPNRICLDT